MATFKLSVTYGNSPYSNDNEGLTSGQAQQGTYAFLRDMFGLPDSAITKLVIEREPGELRPRTPERPVSTTEAGRSVHAREYPG